MNFSTSTSTSTSSNCNEYPQFNDSELDDLISIDEFHFVSEEHDRERLLFMEDFDDDGLLAIAGSTGSSEMELHRETLDRLRFVQDQEDEAHLAPGHSDVIGCHSYQHQGKQSSSLTTCGLCSHPQEQQNFQMNTVNFDDPSACEQHIFSHQRQMSDSDLSMSSMQSFSAPHVAATNQEGPRFAYQRQMSGDSDLSISSMPNSAASPFIQNQQGSNSSTIHQYTEALQKLAESMKRTEVSRRHVIMLKRSEATRRHVNMQRGMLSAEEQHALHLAKEWVNQHQQNQQHQQLSHTSLFDGAGNGNSFANKMDQGRKKISV